MNNNRCREFINRCREYIINNQILTYSDLFIYLMKIYNIDFIQYKYNMYHIEVHIIQL